MSKPSPERQNRIAYIVYSDPSGVRELLKEYDYKAPASSKELVALTKEVVKERGATFIKDLLNYHPEREYFLEQFKEHYLESNELNHCGGCGSLNFSGCGCESSFCGTSATHSNFTAPDSSSTMSLQELEAYYESLKAESKQYPNDPTLSRQIETVWHELTSRREVENSVDAYPSPKKKEQEVSFSSRIILGLGLALMVGIAIGKC